MTKDQIPMSGSYCAVTPFHGRYEENCLTIWQCMAYVTYVCLRLVNIGKTLTGCAKQLHTALYHCFRDEVELGVWVSYTSKCTTLCSVIRELL
jgi:hypothetical protein